MAIILFQNLKKFNFLKILFIISTTFLQFCSTNTKNLNLNKDPVFFKNETFNKIIDFTDVRETYLMEPAIIENEVNSALFFANCNFNDSIIAFKQGIENVNIVKFDKPVSFYNCTFDKPINFRQAYFDDNVYFLNCVFKDEVHFEGVNFNSSQIVFKESKFEKMARFTSSKFKGDVHFTNCTFDSTAKFNNCKFYGLADFSVVKFKEKTDFSTILTYEHIKFNYSEFTDKVILTGINAKDDISLVSIKVFKNFIFTDNKVMGKISLKNADIKGVAKLTNNMAFLIDTTGMKTGELEYSENLEILKEK